MTSAAKIMPMNPQTRIPRKQFASPSQKPVLPGTKVVGPGILPVPSKLRRGIGAVKCSVCPPPCRPSIDGGGVLERCFQGQSSSGSADFGPVMKGGQYGSLSAATLEKGKLDMSQKQAKSSPELSTGGGGGDIGNINNLGGGDGGNDDGDDDDYFDDFEDGEDGDEGGLFRRRMFLDENFDRKFIQAILNEWHKTMMDLPAGLRQACEMGLVSSAQLVKFLAINARPTTARFISRSLPEAMSRAFIGRMLADPAFLYRLLLEQASTIGFAVSMELKNRKDRIKQEWDLALINVLTASVCNAMVVWSLAPCRSYGNTFQFDLQNSLQKLPNNIFEKSYPLREFDLQKRVQSFFVKAAELSVAGLAAGTIQGSLSNFLSTRKKERLSVSIPTVSANALGYGALLGIYANSSYQLLCGSDRLMTNHFDVIGVALFFGTALRIMNVNAEETLKHAWLGIEPDPLVHSDDLLKKAYYNRGSTESFTSKSDSKWFLSKNTIVSKLGLFGTKQRIVESGDDTAAVAPPKAKRKRIVRKKVAAA